MGVDAMEIGVQIRKFMVFLIRTCYRSVSNHPFLVGFLCFSMLLYRSFPLLFSLLVSASPVLVCTAFLLGTLLSFGKPNVPEIDDKEEKLTTYGVASLKTGVVGDDTVVERDGDDGFETVERYVGKTRNFVDSVDGVSLVENRVEEDGSSVDYKPLIEKNVREMKFEKEGIEEEVEGGFDHLESEKEREVREEEPRIEENLKNEEGAAVSLSSKDGELIDSNKEYQLNSWKRVGEESGDEDGYDVDKSSDSGSDGAESSSPDASMADIIPMLDELHPLLDLEAPQRALLFRDASDAASGSSHKSGEDSGDDSVDSEDSDHQGEEGEGEDDNDDDEDEGEEAKGDKEDESKSAIKWTEVDQKNLMDLGTLELERNQRLENLIARRRARNASRLMAEKNLIDLESSDFPFNIPPIATTRRNPFDDSYDDMAIPGSAPSILLPRRNPFDLPYDANEEKPDLKGDSFEQEFSVFQQKEPLYRRNETFNIGTSIFGGPKQEKLDFKWKPYFVPERMASEEGTNYSPFQRQLSENSESKLSSVTSVPDTESASSVVDDEDKKYHEQSASEGTTYAAIQRQTSELSESKVSSVTDTESVSSAADDEDKKLHEQSAPEGTSSPTIQRQISEVSESKVSSVPDTASVSSAVDDEDKKLTEQDVSQETEAISNIDHVANLVKHGSQSSEDLDSVDIEKLENRDVSHDEVEITLGAVENHQESELSLSRTGAASTPTEPNTNEIQRMIEPGEEEFGSMSSLSSPSEEDGKSPDMRKGGSESLESKANSIDRTGISQTSLGESEFQFMSGVVVAQKEPVYDSSPPTIEKFLSFASISAETQQEIYELASSNPLPLPSFKLKESELLSKDIKDMRLASSEVRAVDEGGDVNTVVASDVNPNFDNKTVFTESALSSGIKPEEEYTVYRGEHFLPELEQVGRKLDSENHVDENASASSSVSAPEGQQQLVAVEEQEMHKEETLRVEKDQGQSSSGEKNDSELHEHKDIEMLSADSSPKDAPSEEKSPSELENQSADKSMVEPCYDDRTDPSQEAPIILTKSLEITENANVSEVHDHRDKSIKISSSMNLDATSSACESPEYGSPDAEDVKGGILNRILCKDRGHAGEYFNDSVGAYKPHDDKEIINVEADEIRDIDEGLLSELDTVGDFSVTEVVKSGHTGQISEATNTSSADSNSTNTNLQLPVLEVRSTLDIDMAFRQLHEGADVEEVILPSMLEDQVVSDGSKDPVGHLPVVEARSLEDIHAALKQTSESNPGAIPKPVDSEDVSAKTEETEVISAKQVDLSSTLAEVPKPLESEVEEKEVIIAEEIKASSKPAEVPEPLESRDGIAEVGEEVVSSKKIESSDLADLPKPLDSKDGEDKVEEKEVVPTMQIELLSNLEELPQSKDGGTVVEEKEVLFAKQIESSSNLAEQPEPLESKDGTTKVEEEVIPAKQIESSSNLSEVPKDDATQVNEKEVVPAKQIESSSNGESAVEKSVIAADGLKRGSEEASESSSMSISDDKKGKE